MRIAGHKVHQSFIQHLQAPPSPLRTKLPEQALCRDLQRDSPPDPPLEARNVCRQVLVPFRVRHNGRQADGHEVVEHLIDSLKQGQFWKLDEQVA